MNTQFAKSRLRMQVGISGLLGLLILMLTSAFTSANGQPLPFLSPQQDLGFLSAPYYGSKQVSSYFDHENPDYQRNNRIVLYDGRVASHENGDCGWNEQGFPIAYVDQPNGQGQCIWYEGHPGYDFNLNYEPVLAAADGQVTQARWWDWTNRESNLGLFIEINHGNGYWTQYGHLSAITALTNTQIRRGQIIGTSGDTGHSTGAHLHFEVRSNNNANVTDPFGGAGSQWLWQSGSWDAQGHWVGQPTPHYGSTYVVDDDYPEGGMPDDPNFEKGHTLQGPYGSYWENCPPGQCPYWWRATIGNDGDMFYTNGNDNTSDYWARWLPPQDGLFEVQVYIPDDNATSWQARYYWLASLNGMPSGYAVVDQYGISNQWISLGIRSFGRCFYTTAPWCGVWLSDATDENPARDTHCGTQWCTIGVDAIRFRVPWQTYLPAILKE